MLDLTVIRRFADLVADALGAHREEIDALNVYPVPDSDTGTNLYLTAASARDALAASGADEPAEALSAYARGALLGARGNSGVILSEMLGAALRRLISADPGERYAKVFADALRVGSEAAYRAVATPVEGTMLTVCRVASDAACAEAEDPEARLRDVVNAAARTARTALEDTPHQLPRLAAAGVVDAGGRGVSVIFDCVDQALTGRRPEPSAAAVRVRPALAVAPAADLTEDGPSYEVMFLLDADDAAIPVLRKTLGELGDSLVVVGGEGLWNVHVHVDDVGAAIEAGIEAGRPHRVKVTHFAEQRTWHSAEQMGRHGAEQAGQAGPSPSAAARTGRAIVAVAAGPGLAELFTGADATVVGPSPTTADLVAALTATGAAEVIVLPNDERSQRCADAAARTVELDLGVKVAVIPTVAQVQGLAALAVHDPGAAFDRDVLEMTSTARHARHGAVTVADRQALTLAGPCEPGETLGIIDGEFVRVGGSLEEAAIDVLSRLIGGGGELVTLVSGAEDADGAIAAAAQAWVEEHHRLVEVVVYDGGQPRYPLLVAVE
jgi:DAK2 domain fusion protein YloV